MNTTSRPALLLALAAALLLAPATAMAAPRDPAPAPGAVHQAGWQERSWNDRARRHDGRTEWGQRRSEGQDWGMRRGDRGDRRDRDIYRDGGRHDARDRARDYRGDDRRRRHERPDGDYFGGWSGWREPGNGTYVYGDDNRRRPGGMRIIEAPTIRGPKALGVGPKGFEGACDFSGEVCIIRPGR